MKSEQRSVEGVGGILSSLKEHDQAQGMVSSPSPSPMVTGE